MEQLVRAGLASDGKARALHVITPVNALVEGNYQENVSIAEVLEHGDFGLGSFNNLDGEMVVPDSVVYQLKSDGQAYSAPI